MTNSMKCITLSSPVGMGPIILGPYPDRYHVMYAEAHNHIGHVHLCSTCEQKSRRFVLFDAKYHLYRRRSWT